MKKKCTFAYNYLLSKIRRRHTGHENAIKYLKNKEFLPGKTVLTAKEANKYISERILSGVPFFAGRFGANELSLVKTFDFEVKSKYGVTMKYLCSGAGFFPNSTDYGVKFKDLMIESIPTVDLMGIWLLPFEDYYLKKYSNDKISLTYLLELEPWRVPDFPWSAALKGKKVLIIHPFTETIEKQYAKREKIFPGTNILPEFDLITLKAVQTLAGENDARFKTWFEALEWMYSEAMRIDFDVAIIGCGAYGFPLAAKLKQAGKQVIHLGGVTQLLFGIKGKRWETNDYFTYIQKYFNASWVYPSEGEKPKRACVVEDGCYW